MKRVILLFIALVACHVSWLQAQTLDPQWHDVEKNAQYAVVHKELFGAMQTISIFRYKASWYFIDIVNDPGVKSGTTSLLAKRYNALAAINGSYFNVKTLEPVTYIKENKVQEGYTTPEELHQRVDGLVCTDGHRFAIDICDTLGYAKAAKGYQDAMASGPVLLKNYKRQPLKKSGFYDGFHPRTFLGITADKWIYLVVIDGRFKEAKGMTIEQTATVAEMLGLKDALNLDGGGSSTMWVKGLGVISHPYDNKVFDNAGERVVPNVVIIRKW